MNLKLKTVLFLATTRVNVTPIKKTKIFLILKSLTYKQETFRVAFTILVQSLEMKIISANKTN